MTSYYSLSAETPSSYHGSAQCIGSQMSSQTHLGYVYRMQKICSLQRNFRPRRSGCMSPVGYSFLVRRWLSVGTGPNAKAGISQLQLRELTEISLETLKTRIKAKKFKYPYHNLNGIEQRKLESLAAHFETKLWNSFDSKNDTSNPTRSPNPITLAKIFKPSIENVYELANLLIKGQYPKDLMEDLGQSNEKEALADTLTELYHQHFLEHNILSLPSMNQVDINWDISRPADWFPEARKMKRKIIMHVGPTNSGKTFNSLKAFANSKSGYYAGPLRLLAREIYERFESKGISCNLITGEEIIPSLDHFGNVSGLSSGTIEMIPLHKKMDICIIDEIQMIADEFRGSAWTSAVLGVQAREVHLCGEESAVDLIKELVKATGEELVIKEYKRLGKLTMLQKPVGDLSKLQQGDCLVAFSKRTILELKCMIENTTKLKAGVIYGALPPEIRSQESAKFNNGEYDVLVASDAIGMGLNLRIKRIVFWTTQKFNGIEKKSLSISATKQIAGRAGRYSASEGESEGFVTAFHNRDLKFLQKQMREVIPKITEARIWPPNEFWIHYLSSFRSPKSLEYAVHHFYNSITKKKMKNFVLSDFEQQTQVIQLLCSKNLDQSLTIEDQLKLAQVPINLKNAEVGVINQAIRLLQCISNGSSNSVFDLKFLHDKILADVPSTKNSSDQILDILTQLEKDHKLVLVFLWLAQRWPTFYIDKESASEVKTMIEKRINEELDCLRQVAKKTKKRPSPKKR